MGLTPRLYRYPGSADDVRPYEDLQFLATDIDTDVGQLALRGHVAEEVNNSVNRVSTTAEVVAASETITSPGTSAIYLALWMGSFVGSVVTDIARLRIRYETGPTLSITGTQARIQSCVPQTVSKAQPFMLFKTITGLAAGQWTIGGTVQRFSGTGTCSVVGAATDEEGLEIIRLN
jgi:hypothetical protein